ncbi:MAG: FMN reductase [Sorangiineae bacterium NIC37A_2]|jgi:FMN reductase|nr:MAG: FMN reductase [Sorangiineae bacterium NIC37A_2]
MSLEIVAVSAGLWQPSKTTALARALLEAVAEELDALRTCVELGPIAHELGSTLRRGEAPPRVEEALHRVERADLLIVASPVFRGSYTGHFKHFFDLIDTQALLGKPVVVAATGGGTKHCLVVEHQLRPLFAFFQALTLPTAVYASDSDFENYAIHSPSLQDRIASVAVEARRFFPVSIPIAPLERSHHNVPKNSHFHSR